MLRYLLRQLRYRRGRAAVLGAGILVAAVSFSLLTSAATTSSAQLQGTVTQNFRGAYDLLVRPAGSKTPLESAQELVRPNFLSGIYGGITLDQYHRIQHLDGVEVAAPVAMIGSSLQMGNIPIDLTRFVQPGRRQVLRVRLSWTSDQGLSTYAGGDAYVYVTPAKFSTGNTSSSTGALVEDTDGRKYPLAPDFGPPIGEAQAPFDPASRDFVTYASLSSPNLTRALGNEDLPKGHVGTGLNPEFPMVIAAIDPAAEARLDHLDGAVVAGRYLQEGETPKVGHGIRAVPVLTASRAFVDYQPTVTIERVKVGRPDQLPALLSSDHAWRDLHRATGTTVGTQHFATAEAYQQMLQTMAKPPFGGLDAYWRAGSVGFQLDDRGVLRPQPVQNPTSIWTCRGCYSGYVDVPFSSGDRQFRRLEQSVGSNLIVGGTVEQAGLRPVGRFDVDKLPGFSPLSQVPLGTYRPPTVTPGDVRSRQLLGGQDLLPNGDVAGYVSQPPLLLTTLASLPAFTDPDHYSDTHAEAPISVIRIRVAGVTGPDPASLARLRAVAEQISTTTGLDVDVTAGSSPSPRTIALPAGDHGRPELTLTEGWVKKGVAIAIVHAVDRKSLALFALILIATGCFLASGALAAVRARRTELGTLLCVGWSRPQVFTAVLGELALIGAAAGALGTGLAIALVRLLSLDLDLWRTALITPVAVVLAVTAGFAAAYTATRGSPMDAVLPALTKTRRAARAHTLAGLAWVGLRRRPGRLLLAAFPLFLGVAALALLLGIDLAFHGTLTGSLLGTAVIAQARGVDYLSVALVIVLSAASVADTMLLVLREQAPELAVLRASGWGKNHLVRYVTYQGLGIGAIGAMLGAATGTALATLVGGAAAAAPIAVTAALAALAGITVAVTAALGPALYATRRPPAAVLAEE